MRNRCLILIPLIVFAVSSWAQSSPSPAPQPTPVQVKPVPCKPSSVVPKRVHIGVPLWLQREIDRQAARLGTTVDVKGAIGDATAAKPCPTVAPITPVPPPVQPKAPNPIPAPIVTLHCDPIGVDPADPSGRVVAMLPDPHRYQAPPSTGYFEADKAEPELGASFACVALRVNPLTHRYWLPSPSKAAADDVTVTQSQPKK